MRKSRLVIPGLICFMMASAITTHAVLSMPCGLQQHFLVRNLLMNLIGIIALPVGDVVCGGGRGREDERLVDGVLLYV